MDESLGAARADLITAIEENGAEFLLAMGQAAGSEERTEPDIQWAIGGSPIAYHNCVVRADLAPEAADTEITASIDRLRAFGVPGSWHVGPGMRPADLAARLVAHGFAYAGDDIGMAMDLATLPDDAPPLPPGLVIERVRDDLDLSAWAGVLARSFGEGEPEATWVWETFSTIGFADDVPWRHLLGRLGGEPVATTSLFVGGGAAGVYFVATLPS